jgi:hypothetical protein
MNTSIFNPKQEKRSNPGAANTIKLLIGLALLGSLGGSGWWWFYGSKPRVALSIPFEESTNGSPKSWPVGDNKIVVMAGGRLVFADLSTRKEIWNIALPARAVVDYAWQASVAQRFLKLQDRATELSTTRAKLKTEGEIKAFNAEAAKYAAARADAARLQPPKAPEKKGTPPQKAKSADYTLGDDRSQVDKLKAVQSEDEIIRATRVAKRTEQISKLRASIATLRETAETRLKFQQLKDAESRLQLLEQEQKNDTRPVEPIPEVASANPASQDPQAVSEVNGSVEMAPEFSMLGDAFWVGDGPRLLSFNSSNGELRTTINLPGPIVHFAHGRDHLVVASHAGRTTRYLLKIGADGKTQSFYMPIAETAPSTRTEGDLSSPAIEKSRIEFIGDAVPALAEIRPISETLVERGGPKPGAEAASDAALAGSMTAQNHNLPANSGSAQKPDGRGYRVSIRPLFSNPAPEWTGEIAGRVQFFSTQSLNLVTGGTKLVVLDSKNTKAWEANLSAPALLASATEWDSAPSHPCLEDGERLYFFDRANLTAFKKTSGEVVWRLPSIGIRKVTTTADGSLYVQSANLPADTVSNLSDTKKGSASIVMKINPTDGAIVWTSEKLENVWATGKDVYAMRIGRRPADAESARLDGATEEQRMKIYKLNPSNGKKRWEWFQTRIPASVSTDGKTLGLLYRDELQIIYSTAL